MQNIHTQISQSLNSTFDHAWSQLWRKAYETKDFIPNAQNINISEKTDHIIMREMSVGPTFIKQKITKDKQMGLVTFHNIEGSDLTGDIYNQVQVNKNGSLQLIFASNAKNKQGNNFPPEDLFRKALLRTKQIIQKLN